MNIKKLERTSQSPGTEGETGGPQDPGNPEMGLSDHRDTCVCSSCGIDDVSDCDNAGEFYGTDDLRRRPFFCK